MNMFRTDSRFEAFGFEGTRADVVQKMQGMEYLCGSLTSIVGRFVKLYDREKFSNVFVFVTSQIYEFSLYTIYVSNQPFSATLIQSSV